MNADRRHKMGLEVSRQAAALWAKKRSENGHQYWLPLITHLTDTQNVINWLFDHWLSPGQRQLLCGELSKTETQKLVSLVGFLHDLGKATPVFQVKKSRDGDTSLDKKMKAQLLEAGFCDLDEKYLASPDETLHAKAGEALVENFELPVSIGAIIGGHHGRPESTAQNTRSHNPIEQYPANFYQAPDNTEIQKPWRHVQRELFEYGLASAGYQAANEVPEIKQPQAIVLEGLLIMADWLASSEYLDSDQTVPLFPLIDLDQTWDEDNSMIRLQNAMTNWRSDDQWRPSPIDISKIDPYQVRWGFMERLIQKIMTAAIDKTLDPGMIIIEAPMGSGKTETALLSAEKLAQKTGRDGIFMGLPTQATTNAMFERVVQWMTYIAQQQNATFAAGLSHGKSEFNIKYLQLPDWNSDASVTRESPWFSGKKKNLIKFDIGTIDNLLLMGLEKKHLFLRHLGFSGKVVIIDEAHAYDAYVNQYLYKAIEWLGAYHVPIIILSATLPKAKRKALIDAYVKGKYGKKCRKQLDAQQDWQETQAYPLLSILDGCEIKQTKPIINQKSVSVQVERLSLSNNGLMDQVVRQLDGGGVAGIIVNTVHRAQKLAQLVPDNVPLILLHSAFLATDREKHEAELLAAIGKHGDRPEKLIVIGTQVLEQSLDIDFDVLYTDIAPMDLILQRIGRLHRHSLVRPAALKQPRVYIMGIQDANNYGGGNEAVYGKYLLMKTVHFLPETIDLPADISPLIQKVYDENTDTEISGIEPIRADFDKKVRQKEDRAGKFQISEPSLKAGKTIHDWLDREFIVSRKDAQRVNAAVRDIQETLEVILIQQTENGNFLLDGQRLNDVSSYKIAQQVVRLPAAITLRDGNVDDAIKKLEKIIKEQFPEWQHDTWLKESLVLPLDENLEVSFMDWRLSYSSELGLQYVKEGKDD